MQTPTIDRRLALQEDVSPSFAAEIKATPGGEDLSRCIQCGTCSATCPLSTYMDHTPRNIIAMTRAGFEDEVLASNTIWLCASCYACTVECPKEIKITDVMYTLKQRAIRKRAYSRRFPIPVLAREFFKAVQRTGRSNESRVAARMLMKTHLRAAVGNIPLGVKLMRRGRMSLRRESMSSGLEQMQKLLAHVEGLEADRRT